MAIVAKTGVYWPFKTLLEGAGINLVEDGNTVRIVATGGGGGPGGGDMLKSEYAPSGLSGIVDHAILADTATNTTHAAQADSVPWTGITGTPTLFPTDWSYIQNKPGVFPSAWSLLSGIPTQFPSDWSIITSKPTSFPSDWSIVTNKPTVFPTAVSTDQGNTAALGSDGYIYVPPFSAWGEDVDAVINGAGFPIWQQWATTGSIAIPATAGLTRTCDRFKINKSAPGAGTVARVPYGLADTGLFPLFSQLDNSYRYTVGTPVQNPAPGDYFLIETDPNVNDAVQLFGQPSSILVVVRSTVAGTFTVCLRNADVSRSILFPCTIATPNTVQKFLIQNIPVMPTDQGSWQNPTTFYAYSLAITLMAGTSFINSTTGQWLPANVLAAPGQSNFCAASGNQFELICLRHVPGKVINPFVAPVDDDVLWQCQRFYCKTYAQETSIQSINAPGWVVGQVQYNDSLYPGTFRFPRTMIRIPTVRLMRLSTGAIPAFDYRVVTPAGTFVGGATSITGNYWGVSDAGWAGFTMSTNSGGSGMWYGHYDATAD